MQLARMFGIMIVFGVPAIIGGGLFFHLLHSWVVVAIFEALLVCGAATTAWKAAGPSK
ncbi:MAG: hypothetical protein HWN69_05395 [Desulfobacterales bacterium]|nr:hypothetical protein [Desulfobacterales bacterium]